MTANELADKCNRLQSEIILGFLADCATMLRQQQAEIESLSLRELTEDEILEVCSQIEPLSDITIEQAFIHFARAILKKAREK